MAEQGNSGIHHAILENRNHLLLTGVTVWICHLQ